MTSGDASLEWIGACLARVYERPFIVRPILAKVFQAPVESSLHVCPDRYLWNTEAKRPVPDITDGGTAKNTSSWAECLPV